MEDVIRRIIEIEEEAQKILKDTKEENARKENEAREALDHLHEKIVGDAHRKEKELRKKELRENATAAREIRAKCDEQLIRLEEKVKLKEEEWVKMLVDAVLGD